MTETQDENDDQIPITCGECNRPGDVKPRFVRVMGHIAAFEELPGDMVRQWQYHDNQWFCQECLADAAGGGEEYYPEGDEIV